MKLEIEYTNGEIVTLVPDVLGWIPGPNDRPARVRHDVVSRTLSDDWGFNISITNEIRQERPVINDKVEIQNKITMKLKGTPWEQRFPEVMGEEVFWERFINDGFGWMDYPDNTELRYNNLQCGGNLVNVTGTMASNAGRYALVDTQDFYSEPDILLDYFSAPHLTIKQTLVGHTPEKVTYWTMDKKQNRGDLMWPSISYTQAAMLESELEYYPSLPFECDLGTVTQWRFTGSQVFGLIGSSWVLLEEMAVMPLSPIVTATSNDRRVYCNPWPMTTFPPPVLAKTYPETW